MNEEHDDNPGFLGHVGGDLPQPGNNPSDQPGSDENQWATRGGRGGRGNRGRGRGNRRGHARGGSNGRDSGSQVPNPSAPSRSDNDPSNSGLSSSNTPRGRGKGRSNINLSTQPQGIGRGQSVSGRSHMAGNEGNLQGASEGSTSQATSALIRDPESGYEQQPGSKSGKSPDRGGEGERTQSPIREFEEMKLESEVSAPKSKDELLAEKREGEQERKKKESKRKEKLQEWESDAQNMPPLPPPSESSDSSKTIRARANFYRISFEDKDLRLYAFILKDEDDLELTNRDVRREAIREVLSRLKPPSKEFVTDYFGHVVSVGSLYDDFNDDGNEHLIGSVSILPPWGEPKVSVQISVVFQRKVNHTELLEYLLHKEGYVKGYVPGEDIRALNMVPWGTINDREDGARKGSKFFSSNERLKGSIHKITPTGVGKKRKDIDGPTIFEARTGFFASVRPADCSLLLNVNCTTSAFYPPMILQDWISKRFRSDIPPFKIWCLKELKGLKVKFLWDPPDSTKEYKIFGFHQKSVSVARCSSDSDETVFDHWSHCQDDQHPEQLNSNACCIDLGTQGSPAWYPADKLEIIGWQPYRQKVPRLYSKSMMKIAAQAPEDVKNCINEFARPQMGILPASLKQFGLIIDPDLVEVEGRHITRPSLLFKNYVLPLNAAPSYTEDKNVSRRKFPATWDVEMLKDNADAGFHTPIEYSKLSIISLYYEGTDHGKAESKLAKCAEKFVGHLGHYGLGTTSYAIEEACYTWDNDYSTRRYLVGESLEKAFDRLETPKLLVIVLPNENESTYSDVKWWADCVQGVPTICFQSSKAKSPSERTLANFCLKVNAKLGGTNHGLHVNDHPSSSGPRQNVMIVGADVSHAQRRSDPNCPSVAGVVATYDQDSWQYAASARLQERNQEYIADLRGMIKERVSMYKAKVNCFPEYILFYRDGVSESQYGMVHSKELRQIEEGCQDAGMTNPKITLLVVGKRHHTRFFPPSKRDFNTESLNFPAGLVVDRQVVEPQTFNFYLQSHDSPVGTAKPAHYVVISNGCQYSPQELQDTTYKLCFTGSRATVSLSVCPPARYADLLCTRLRCYMAPFFQEGHQLENGSTLDAYTLVPSTWKVHPKNPFGPDDSEDPDDRQNPWHPKLRHTMFYL